MASTLDNVINPPLTGMGDPILDKYKSTIPKKYGAISAEADALSQLQGRKQQQTKALEDKYQPQMTDYQDKIKMKEQEISTQMENMPTFQQPADFKAEHMKPEEVANDYALYAAMAFLGGARSRAPMQAAITGFTGAVEGMVKGDEAKVEEQYKTYKTNFDKAIKSYEEELKAYKNNVEKNKFDIDALIRGHELIRHEYEAGAKQVKEGVEDIEKRIDSMSKALEKAREVDQRYAEMALRKSEAKAAGKAAGGTDRFTQNILGSTVELARSLKQLSHMGLKVNSGMFGMMDKKTGFLDAPLNAVARLSTDDDAQIYQTLASNLGISLATIESNGYKPTQAVTDKFDKAFTWQKGDSLGKKLYTIADSIAQAEVRSELALAKGNVPEEQKAIIRDNIKALKEMFPFQPEDIIDANKQGKTFKELIEEKSSGLRKETPAETVKPYDDAEKERRYQEWKAKNAT